MTDDTIKAGRRHSRADVDRLKKVKANAAEIVDAAIELGADADEVEAAIEEGADDAVKALSLSEREQRVRRAFDRAYGQRGDMPMAVGEYGWLSEVYDTYAVVCHGTDYYKVTYTENADGVTFAERDRWQRVEKEWAAKSLGEPGDAVVAYGGALKALDDNGKVGGYLVRFSTETDPDLTGEWFTAKTYFGPRDGDGVDAMFHHGIPIPTKKLPREKLEALADHLFAPFKTRKDELGIWAEAVMDMADEYEAYVYGLVKAGKLGLSSGAPGHTVRRKSNGEITRWIIAEGSYTPTPAEPRNRIATVKALASSPIDLAWADTPAPSVAVTPQSVPTITINQTFNASADATKTAVDSLTAMTALYSGNTNPVPSEPSVGAAALHDIQEVQVIEQVVTAAAPPVAPVFDVDAIAAQIATKAFEALQAKLDAEPAIKSAGYDVPNVHVKREREELTDEGAFKAWLRFGDEVDERVRARMRAKRAAITGFDPSGQKATLNETTDGQGGYWVPTLYSNELNAPLTNMSYVRMAGARVMQVTGTDSFKLNGLTNSGAATIGGEGSQYTQDEPTATEIDFNPYKLKKLAKATEEAVADSRFDLWGTILQPDFEQAFAEGENTYFTTGTGSGQPQGVVYGATVGVTAASQTAPTADEIIALQHSVDYKYRGNAKFMMADSTLAYIRKLKGGDGHYLVGQGMNGAPGDTLLGQPVVINNSMAALATGNDVILYGNFNYYRIADWQGLQIQRLNELYAETGHIGFRAYRRIDGNIMQAAAFRKLRMA